MYAPLYVKTTNSLLDSMIKIDDLIAYAKANNIKALSIADNSMFGVMEFYQKCLKNDIKPIIGLEIIVEEKPIVLYAMSNVGYLNLIKINALKEKTIENLVPFYEDLICIVPFDSKPLYHQINKIFKHYYMGHSDVREGSVFFSEVLYLKKEEKNYLKYLRAIKKGVSYEEISPIKEDHHLVMENELTDDEKKLNHKIVSMCNLVIEKKTNLIPKYSDDSYALLRKKCKEGLRARFGDVVLKKYVERLKYEMDIINSMGFCDYFLIVHDYVLYAKNNNILVGPGRGSAAGSLVSYALFITDVDPIKYDLLFERFLNPERITLPDIDIDFEDVRRDEVIDYCIKKYGVKRVAPIITFGTLASKQALRDVGRAMMIDIPVIDKLCKLIDASKSLTENYKEKKVREFVESRPVYKDLYKIAMKFEGLKRHTSIHAAGIVMASEDLDNIIPIENKGDHYLTSYSMEYLEDLGLLKMDFLGLKNLTLLKKIIENTNISINEIPLDDDKTINLFKEGDTLGIFQFESSGMISFLQNLKPNSFEDIFAAIALYRPGPMKNIETFIKRKQGTEKINYFHPDLEEILAPTYGVIVYQEQIMQIANKMAGYSMGEADVLRKAMGKKNLELMNKEKDVFIRKCVEKNYDEDLANKVFSLILRFAEFGFNKAHSVSYAMISYKMAYLKVHFPKEFMVALLESVKGSEVKTREYIVECKKRGLTIKAPDVKKSSLKYEIDKNTIIMPLSIIKGVGVNTAEVILENRESYFDIFDFVKKTYGKSVNKGVLVNLIYAGALDCFGLNRRTMIENLDKFINYGDLMSDIDDDNLKPVVEKFSEFSLDELIKKEYEVLGFYLKDHPVTKYKNNKTIALNDVSKYFDKNVTVVGMVDKLKEIKTKNGDLMAFANLSDEFSTVEAVIFPNTYAELDIKEGEIVEVFGKIEKRNDRFQIIVTNLKSL